MPRIDKSLGELVIKAFRELCGQASTADELQSIVAGRDPRSLTATHAALINHAARRIGFPASLRVAFAGTHSMDPLPGFLRARAVGLGIGIEEFVAPYGQYMQPLLDDGSELAAFRPDLVFVSLAMRQIAPRVHDSFAMLGREALDAERARILGHMAEVADLVTARLGATALLANFPRPAQPALGVADARRELGETEFYLELNLQLMRMFRDNDRVQLVDLDRLVGGGGRPDAERMYFLAKCLWDPDQANAIAGELLRHVVASTGRARKCLVVDLDNTLWGGVAGEDGPEGVKVGPGSPVAEAFESFQHALRGLRQRGVMLAVCSKNNPEDAEAVFRARPGMPLKRSDFSAWQVSWRDKPSAILDIARELNIGLDSLVFVDDNPAERAMVRGALPEVQVLELPADPAKFAAVLQQQPHFEKLRIGADDLTRLADYQSRKHREQLRVQAGDLQSYLRELGTEVRVRHAGPGDLARVHELFNKTNQFNLTTRRYSLADVERFHADPEWILGVASARDSFGDMGTIGVYLVECRDGAARLDSFLMSCRALGRGIETAVMNCLKREVREQRACATIRAEFIPSRKNAPARGFLAAEAFALESTTGDGTEHYRLEGPAFAERPCPHLEVTFEYGKDAVTA